MPPQFHFSRFLGLCAASVAIAIWAIPASAAPVPSVVLRAAAANARALQGTLVHDRHITISVAAGPMHYSEQNDARLLMADGLYEQLRYTHVVENGKTLGPAAIEKRDEQINSELARGSGNFKQPFDTRFLQDYSYQTDAKCVCLPNAVAVRFHSLVRDDAHGDGTMQIDRASGRVLGVTYTPDVLPAHASSCTTTEAFAEVLPGVWTIVRIERSYHGHVAFFGGGGDVVETLDHFKAVRSARAGLTYLNDIAQSSGER